MRSMKLIAAIAAVMLAVGAGLARADQNITNNSVAWTYTYEGNYLPGNPLSDPAWTSPFPPSGGASESVFGGILTVSTPDVSENIAYRQTGGTGNPWDPTAAGSTIEARLKVDSLGTGSAWAQSLMVRTGSRMYWLAFGTNVVQDPAAGGFAFINTTDGFHDYRFTVSGLAGIGSLYLDGSQTPLFTTTGIADSANVLDFGDVTGIYDGGTVRWDYIRWTNAGAFSIPEPSAVMMLALGGTLLLRAQRKD